MKIVIITVCYNDILGLKKTLKSVQKYKSNVLKHIIIDGSSNDGTKDLLSNESEKNKKIIYKSEPDNGIFDAMNKGMKILKQQNFKSKSYYIWFLNSGDIADEFLFDNLIANEKLLFFVSKQVSPFVPSYFSMRPLFKKNKNRFKDWIKYNSPVHQAVLFKSDIKDEIFYDTKFTNQADTKLIYELLKNHSYKFFDKVLCVFELGGNSGNYSKYKKVIDQLTEDLFIKNILTKRSFFFIYSQVLIFHFKYFLSIILGDKNFHRLHLYILKIKYFFQSFFYSK
tara:strand:+ start:122 stop:967 length:846 start_codon:yes stop_codon:yes gene_type:complete